MHLNDDGHHVVHSTSCKCNGEGGERMHNGDQGIPVVSVGKWRNRAATS